MLDSLKFRKSKWDKDVPVPIALRKLRKVFDQERRIKVSLFVSALPNESTLPKARFDIDFLEGVSLDNAIRSMQDLRDLLSVLCNDFVDIQNPVVMYREKPVC